MEEEGKQQVKDKGGGQEERRRGVEKGGVYCGSSGRLLLHIKKF